MSKYNFIRFHDDYVAIVYDLRKAIVTLTLNGQEESALHAMTILFDEISPWVKTDNKFTFEGGKQLTIGEMISEISKDSNLKQATRYLNRALLIELKALNLLGYERGDPGDSITNMG